jgi:hypothetical protein
MCKDRGREGILDFEFQISDFVLQTEVLMSFVILTVVNKGA